MAKNDAQGALSALMMAQAFKGNDDPEIQEMLKYFLAEQVETFKKQKAVREARAVGALRLAEEIVKKRAFVRRSCSHRKPYPSHGTRLAGQHLGNGQLMLVCQRCGSDWYLPPRKGQIAPPPELMPPSDSVGGPQAYAHNVV